MYSVFHCIIRLCTYLHWSTHGRDTPTSVLRILRTCSTSTSIHGLTRVMHNFHNRQQNSVKLYLPCTEMYPLPLRDDDRKSTERHRPCVIKMLKHDRFLMFCLLFVSFTFLYFLLLSMFYFFIVFSFSSLYFFLLSSYCLSIST